jgi:hypothetical protein
VKFTMNEPRRAWWLGLRGWATNRNGWRRALNYGIWIVALGATGYLFLRGRTKGQNIFFLSLGLIIIAVFMSGGRGAAAIVFEAGGILSVAFLWGAPWRWNQAHRLVRSIRRAVIASILAFALIIVIFPKEIGARFAFYEETLSPYSAPISGCF